MVNTIASGSRSVASGTTRNWVAYVSICALKQMYPISTSMGGRGQMRQNPDRIFTTTSRDADMAGDEPAVQREWTRAGAGRLQGKGSKLVGSRQVHKHR